MKNLLAKHICFSPFPFFSQRQSFPWWNAARGQDSSTNSPGRVAEATWKGLRSGSGVIMGCESESKGHFRAVTWPLGLCRHIALETFPSSIIPGDKSNKTSPRHTQTNSNPRTWRQRKARQICGDQLRSLNEKRFPNDFLKLFDVWNASNGTAFRSHGTDVEMDPIFIMTTLGSSSTEMVHLHVKIYICKSGFAYARLDLHTYAWRCGRGSLLPHISFWQGP